MSFKWKQLSAKSTSTTEVIDIAPAQKNMQPILRKLYDLPSNASDNINIYLPRPELQTIVTQDATPTQSATHVFINADVAGGHVVGGFTLTTNDFLILSNGTQLVVRAISAVADVASKIYCDVTVPTMTTASTAGTRVWVVRAADVLNFVSGGTSLQQIDFPYVGYLDCPLAIGAKSAGSNNQTVQAVVLYNGPASAFPDTNS